jgi:hypothetical protein
MKSTTTITKEDLPMDTALHTVQNPTTLEIVETNFQALVNSLAGTFFKLGLNPKQAIALAVAFVDCIEELEDGSVERWVNMMEADIDETFIGVEKEVYSVNSQEFDWEAILVKSGVISISYEYEGDDESEVFIDAGEYLIRLLSQQTNAYKPIPVGAEFERRFDYSQVRHSELFEEAVHALESTLYTVDDNMLSIVNQVMDKLPKTHKLHQEDYVFAGCNAMDSDWLYYSEFKGDRRGRIYQASCHGPNGQSSDVARSLMDLGGVSMDYDPQEAMKLLVAEMKDMGKFVDKGEFMASVYAFAETPVECILMNVQGHKIGSNIKKPWSFAKASMTLLALQEYIQYGGVEKPYIGMAFGLDAKCSGPQLGALMVADQDILAACGFTLQQIDDAYHRAIVELEGRGKKKTEMVFMGLEREDVKKPFMGIFYGQGWRAFMHKEDFLKDDGTPNAVWVSMHGNGDYPPCEERAQAFWGAINRSFGAAMNNIRRAIREFGYDFDAEMEKSDKPTRHFMPDGFEVAMDYRKKQNIFGELMGKDAAAHDVTVQTGMTSMKFNLMTFKMDEYDTMDFARNGFVNMIQAADALLARLIIVNCKKLGAEHIISVHDCFRVNVNDMEILREAIKLSYKELFGSTHNMPTKHLPKGTDILKMYFEGASKALKPEYKDTMPLRSQFFGKSELRRLNKVKGVQINELIDALGTSYYFDK